MSATAAYTDAMETEEFATLLSAPAGETPTPDSEPAPAAEDDAPESTPTPEAGAEPAEEAAKPATPEPPKPEEKPQWQLDLEAAQERAQKAERQVETLHAQTRNAAAQAAAQARQQATAEFQQGQRQQITQQLQQMVLSGEASQEEANALYGRYKAGWDAEDQKVRDHAQRTQTATTVLQAVDVAMQQKEVALQRQAIPLIAQDFGLPVEMVAQVWADPEELSRFRRAVGQTDMAQRFPDSGHNAAASEDYLRTAANFFQHIATLRTTHAAEKAAWDKERADLTMQLNRDAAPAAPPETPARGAGRRPRDADERATQILTENADALMAAFRG